MNNNSFSQLPSSPCELAVPGEDPMDPNLLSIGRDKRSFRRPSGTPADHSISAALIDANTPKRVASTRQKSGKKVLINSHH